MIKYTKILIVCPIFFLCVFASFCEICSGYEPVQTVIITYEDIKNAKPAAQKVNLTPRELRDVEIMEKRHFPRTYPEFSHSERLKNLEYELFGKIWEFSPKADRIRRLKIASSNTMLSGTALPAALSSKRMAKRASNTSLETRPRDNVGLFDGLLRLVNPDAYDVLRKREDKMFEYEY